VGDEHDRRASFVEGSQAVDDRFAVVGVEIPGWFVGDNDGSTGRECPGDGNPLTLTAGELGGSLLREMAESDRCERLLGEPSTFGAGNGPVQKCELDAVGDGAPVEQVEALEDECKPVGPQLSKSARGRGAGIGVPNFVVTGGGFVEQTDDVE